MILMVFTWITENSVKPCSFSNELSDKKKLLYQIVVNSKSTKSEATITAHLLVIILSGIIFLPSCRLIPKNLAC